MTEPEFTLSCPKCKTDLGVVPAATFEDIFECPACGASVIVGDLMTPMGKTLAECDPDVLQHYKVKGPNAVGDA